MTRSRPSARCRALLIDVSRYLDGELPPARRRTIEQHIDRCTCCGTLADNLRKTIEACRAEGKRPPPGRVLSRAAARVRALIAAHGTPRVALAPRRRARRQDL